MGVRNCGNHKGLSDEALAVIEYQNSIVREHKSAGATKVFSLGNIRLYECPLTYIADETRQIIRTVYLVENSNRLLFPGEWTNQPYWLIEALELYRVESAPQTGKPDDGGKKP